MDDLDEFIAEHMKTYGLRLAWVERLSLCETARAQSDLPAEQFVLGQLREMSALRAA